MYAFMHQLPGMVVAASNYALLFMYMYFCVRVQIYIYVCMYVSNGGNAFHQSGIQICVTIHVYKHGYACANPCIYVCMYVLDVGTGRR